MAIKHSKDCWKKGPEHYACAVEEIKQLRYAVELLKHLDRIHRDNSEKLLFGKNSNGNN